MNGAAWLTFKFCPSKGIFFFSLNLKVHKRKIYSDSFFFFFFGKKLLLEYEYKIEDSNLYILEKVEMLLITFYV